MAFFLISLGGWYMGIIMPFSASYELLRGSLIDVVGSYPDLLLKKEAPSSV
tara:strand:+ start:292 stop:444 length:153 start_codon:yes stop_codon:yes gene_type:complete